MLLGGLAGSAAADTVEGVANKLVKLDAQAIQLEASVRNAVRPEEAGVAERRLVEGQVAHGVGNYADASILLYDVVEKHPNSRAYRQAIFYLADSLFHKGDNFTSREYFQKVVDEYGDAHPNYQTALERLVELTTRTGDTARVAEYFSRLDRLPQSAKLDSVAYVRGKYEYHNKAHDSALRYFEQIQPTSKYYFQARYFSGVTLVAKGDLAAAAKAFQEIGQKPPQNDADKRIVELSHLALGRIYYDRDQAVEAVDAYLQVNRKSPLFDEALFEVAFVYVKAKQFDKALRALELLTLADPASAMKPDVRILEGNLRIRKAQAAGQGGSGTSAEEYQKADKVFTDTRVQYEKPKAELDALIAQKTDPRPFFDQLAGHAEGALDVQVELAPVVVEWLKQEAAVARTLAVSKDLDQVRTELDDSDQMLVRIERAIASSARVKIFPELGERWIWAREYLDETQLHRVELANHQAALVDRYVKGQEKAELARLREKRRELVKRLLSMPNSGGSYQDRQRKAREAYDAVDKQAAEVDAIITTMEAELVAMEKYHRDLPPGKTLPKAEMEAELVNLRKEIAAQRAELDSLRQVAMLGQEEAGFADELAQEEAAIRRELSYAVAAETAAYGKILPRLNAEDQAKGQQISRATAIADRIERRVNTAVLRIEQLADAQLVSVRATVVEEKARVAEYRKVLAAYDVETNGLGSEVVADSLGEVARKFYGFIVRSDVGILDVAWSQKEQSQRGLDRMRLDFASEKNTLDSEFRDIKEEEEKEPEPAPAPETPPPAEGAPKP
jgi:tetratricopeptide (TPR) repeat protein